MKGKARLFVFAAGAAVFAFLIFHVGLDVLLENFRRAGLTLIPVVLVWIPVFIFWAAAWRQTMAGAEDIPPFWRLCTLAVSSLAVNLVTPFAQVGGEAFRATAVAPWLGGRRATSSVITYYMLHALSNMVVWLAGIVMVIVLYTPPAALAVPLVVVGLIIIALMLFVVSRHQQGIVVPAIDLLHTLPVLRRLVPKLVKERAHIEELDHFITQFYRQHPGRFWLALLLDFIGRCIAFAEYWFVGVALGLHVSWAQAFVIGSLGALIINVIFFMPMEAGTKEGSLFYAFRMVGLDASLGVFAAIVQRLRELTWIAIGLLLIWLAGDRETLKETKKTKVGEVLDVQNVQEVKDV